MVFPLSLHRRPFTGKGESSWRRRRETQHGPHVTLKPNLGWHGALEEERMTNTKTSIDLLHPNNIYGKNALFAFNVALLLLVMRKANLQKNATKI